MTSAAKGAMRTEGMKLMILIFVAPIIFVPTSAAISEPVLAKACTIVGVTAQDCKVEHVDGVLPSLKALEGTSVNVDELDMLTHILDIKIDDGADA